MSNVKLVWTTPDAEKQIMHCARVSNPKNQDSTDSRLLSYCAKHGHWSIFEMASMCVEINTSRTIARQILRHRSFSFQEFSQRYANVEDMGQDVILTDARSQDLKNRQNSNDDMDEAVKIWWTNAQYKHHKESLALYREALSHGIAKECARVVLPEGNTPSRMYMTGTVRSWIHFLQLRLGNGTQKEHQDIAKEILSIFKQELPVVADALVWETP